MRTTALALCCAYAVLAAAVPAAADPPDLYRQVAGLTWVVKDLDAVEAAWARMGFPAQRLGEMDISGSYAGASGSARFRVSHARIAGLDVTWLQPLDDSSGLSAALAEHGEGVFSINFRAPSREALEAEVARLQALGVGVLQRAEVPAGAQTTTIVQMDTRREGKYVLGLVHGGAPAAAPEAPLPFPLKLSQYALVVKDLAAVSAYWEKLGFPKMDITHGTLGDLVHRGKPGTFDQKLGWHRYGTVTWEWIESVRGPTVYDEFLAAHGEGFHHLAFDVPDMDAAIAECEKRGAPIVQSGAWGEKGKPNSGRFAYAATDTAGGVMVELLWNQR
jgi:catechol 2,3-dioxygenase-like lactoylglutathione lyase family enzyme